MTLPIWQRTEACELTDRDIETLLRLANDPEYMAGVKAMLDRIRERGRIPTRTPKEDQ